MSYIAQFSSNQNPMPEPLPRANVYAWRGDIYKDLKKHVEKLDNSEEKSRESLLTQLIESLSKLRDQFIHSFNDPIVHMTRERNLLLEKQGKSPQPATLGMFDFRTIVGMPVGDRGVIEIMKNKGAFKTLGEASVTTIPIVIKDGKKHMVLIEKAAESLDGKVVISFPGGWVDPDKTPEITALKETQEETGWIFDPSSLKMLATLAGKPAGTRELMHYALLEGESKVGDQNLEPEEIGMKKLLVPLETIDDWLKEQQQQGKIINDLVLTGLYLYRRYTDLNASPIAYTPNILNEDA